MSKPTRLLAASLALALCAPVLQAQPFTYQGHLEFNGVPVHGSADLVFRLFDSETGGSPIDSPMQATDWPVAQGIFTIDLDFAGVVFDGSPRWLEVEANGQVLAGRIPLMGAPFAHSANALRGRSVATTAPGSGQVLAWNGSAWAPADAAAGSSYQAGTGLDLSSETFSILPDYRLPQSCSGDQVPKWSGSAWACAADADTIYSQGTGLDLSGTTFSVAPAYRLPTGGCGASEVAKWSGSAWACAADADTIYSADTGLVLAGTRFSVAPGYRLPQACSGGEVAKWNGSAWACAADDGGSYTAGTGLALSGSEFSVAPGYRLPQACTNGQLAKWDGSAWACAADTDTTYSVGSGLNLVGNQFAADFAGSGTATSVARSDHGHYGASWLDSHSNWGLFVTNFNAGNNATAITGRMDSNASDSSGVKGTNTSPSGVGVRGVGRSGVRGDSGSDFPEGEGVFGWRTGPSGYGVLGWATGGAATIAVAGRNFQVNGKAIWGRSESTDAGTGVGVHGQSLNVGGTGVLGQGSTGVRGEGGTGVSAEGVQVGVTGLATDSTGVGVEGFASSATGNTTGVWARALSPNGVALKAEHAVAHAVTGLFQALGSGSSVGLRSESWGDDPDAMAVHARLDNGSGEGVALFAEHRAGGVAVKLDGVLRMTPRISAPISCELGDLFVHSSGGLCFCNSLQVWEQINPSGTCF